jgi:hypothetical protein
MLIHTWMPSIEAFPVGRVIAFPADKALVIVIAPFCNSRVLEFACSFARQGRGWQAGAERVVRENHDGQSMQIGAGAVASVQTIDLLRAMNPNLISTLAAQPSG